MGSILLVLLFMHLRSYLDVSFFQTLRFLKFLIFHWWKLHFIPLHCNQNTIFKWWELTHSFICCVSDCLHANPFTLCVFTIHWWTCYQETPHVPSEVSPVERGKEDHIQWCSGVVLGSEVVLCTKGSLLIVHRASSRIYSYWYLREPHGMS